MALISTQAAGSVKGFGFTRPYVAPPAPVADSKNAILNLSLNHDYDGNHNNATYSSSGSDLWGNFKDETGNNYPQPKHDHAQFKNTFHSHLSPYHPAGWSCEFNSTYSLANYSTNGNDPGTSACTWETWVLLHPHQANQISGAGNSNRNMVISGRDTNTSSGSESDGAWTFGIAGNTTVTATGVYLIYRNGGTTYKKYWYQGNPANSGLPIPRGQWHHIAIVRHQGTDGSNVYKCYLNGTQLINTQYDTFPDNMHISSSGTRAVFFGGYRTVETGGNILDGKIKDYALTHSAKYTSNFTPPIKPMSQALDSSVNLMFPYGPTYAIGSAQSDVVNTNTSQIGWLMKQVNTSGTWQTAAYIERTSMVRSSPYDYVVDYAKNNLLGSVYMNPQNSYRSGISQGPITSGNIGSDPGISLGTNDFTIEFWYYMNGNNGGASNQERQTFIDFRPTNGNASNNGPYMYYWKPQDGSGGLKIEYPGISMSSHQVMQQQWVHVAIVRSGDLGYLYINGNQSGGSASLAGRNFSAPDGRPMWGCTGNNYTSSSTSIRDQFNGYMTDCRITVGTVVYTGNFKPPIGKLTLTGGDYPNTTNVNVSIPTGHVKQLLSFTNNPFHDTVGKEQYMHPFFSSVTTYPAVDIIKDKEEAEAADFSTGKQEGIIYASNSGSTDKFGLDVAVDSAGTTLVASAPYEDTGGTDRGMAYILKKGASTTLQGAAYDNVYSPQVTNANFGVDMSKPTSILFNADGTKLYLGDMTSLTIYQWSLSSPYSITSGSFTYDNKSYYVGGTGLTQTLLSIKWNNDGTKLYTLSNSNDKIFEHDLSTAYDISTASYSNVNFTHSQESSSRGFGFSHDGTKMFVGGTTDRLHMYNLSTAWDLSTASYSNGYMSHGVTSYPADVYFDEGGTRMFLLSYGNNIRQYNLSVPFNPTTGTVTAPYLIQINSQESQAYSYAFNSDFSKFYVVGPNTDKIYQYSTGGATAVYTEEVSLANPNSTNQSFFGWNVGINDAGTRVVVGMPGPYVNNAGTDGYTYVYDKSGSSWPTSPTATIQSSDFTSGDFFGKGCNISGDGNYIVVGAERENGYPGSYSYNGSAYIFYWNGSAWTQQAKLSEAYTANHNDNYGRYFGQAIAVDTDGDTIAIGAPGMTDLTTQNYNATYGHAEVWVRNGTTWAAQAEIKPADGDRLAEDGFGANLALSGDGNTLVVGQKSYQGNAGSNAIGNAWVFTRSGTTWTLLQKLTAGLTSGDWFGFDVAITKDAKYIAVSAPKEAAGASNQNAGKVFTFRKVGSMYALQGSIEAEDVTADDLFGYSLAITNDKSRVITGAPHEDKTSSSSANIGAVYTHTPGSIANWPATEPSQVGGATTTGKSYMYFTGGGNTSNMMSKLIYPYGYDQVNSGAKKSAVFEGMAFTNQSIDGYAFTVEAWIYPMQPASDNNNTEHHLWSYGDPNENYGIISLKLKQASSSDTTFQWVFETSRDTDNNMASNNNYNQWYHVALVALGGYEQPSTGGRGAEYRFFVNGVRDTTISTININNYNWLQEGGAFIIGGQHVYSDYRMFDAPISSMSSYGNGHRNFTGIVRNFRVERTNKYWSSNFTPTDLTSI